MEWDDDDGDAGSTEFLAGAFFLVDEVSRQEGVADDEVVLFFHPADVALRTQVSLNGACAAIEAFAQQFTQDPVHVLTLERFTFCFRAVGGGLTMVLSGPVEEPVTALTRRLERIATWFRFFHGSFAAVGRQCATRKELCALFGDIGAELVAPLDPSGLSLVCGAPCGAPALAQGSGASPGPAGGAQGSAASLDGLGGGAGAAQGAGGGPAVPMSAAALATVFHPLPKAECSSRQFILASQLLSSIASDPLNLAGCIFCGRAVLFSQLDIATTDAVAVQALATFKAACKSQRSSEFAPFTELKHVYLPRPYAESLCAASLRLRGGADDDWAWVRDDSRDVPSDDPRAPAPLVPLGLFVYVTKRTSLAMLMSPDAVDDQRHVKTVQKMAQAELLQIENGSAAGALDPVSDALAAAGSPGDSSADSLSLSMAGPCGAGGSAGLSGLSGSGSTPSIAAVSQGLGVGDLPCPWVMSDELMGVLSSGVAPLMLAGGPGGAAGAGAASGFTAQDEAAFKDLIGVAHDALAEEDVTQASVDYVASFLWPAVEPCTRAAVEQQLTRAPLMQVYLRRRSGAVLARRLFAKELHWYVPASYTQGVTHERLVDVIERSRNIAFCDNRDGQLF
eukprot:m51a1_g10348 hypothetical protein (621) ;mRNA; f:170311-172882